MARVLSLNASVTVPYGSFDRVLETKEWTPLEPAFFEKKYYVRGVGPLGNPGRPSTGGCEAQVRAGCPSWGRCKRESQAGSNFYEGERKAGDLLWSPAYNGT